MLAMTEMLMGATCSQTGVKFNDRRMLTRFELHECVFTAMQFCSSYLEFLHEVFSSLIRYLLKSELLS
jgi:hypothetical protein